MYPENDDKYTDKIITGIEVGEKFWTLKTDAGCLYVERPAEYSFPEPAVGMKARFYGTSKGMLAGSTIRGVFLEGNKVYYRTEDEDRKYQNDMMYGVDAADWLARWDRNETVWSISMGGFGPGYEQVVQITAAEILRHLLSIKYDSIRCSDRELWNEDLRTIESAVLGKLNGLGLSGAQFNAGVNLAMRFYSLGPQFYLTDQKLKDRHIQVCKTFPSID